MTSIIYVKNKSGKWVEYQRLHGDENRIWVENDKIQETLKPEAIRGAKINMILEHIAHEENIVVTEEEVEFELKIKKLTEISSITVGVSFDSYANFTAA